MKNMAVRLSLYDENLTLAVYFCPSAAPPGKLERLMVELLRR